MTEGYYLFGSTSDDMNGIGAELASVLGLEPESRTSSYKGGSYLKLRSGEFKKLTVEKNWIDDEGNWAEPDFPMYPMLVYVAGPSPGFIVALEAVPMLKLLRVEELE